MFSVAGYGAKRPASETDISLNRRIDFRFIMTPPLDRELKLQLAEELK